MTQPAHILAAGLPRSEFAPLFASVLRAFHPRHLRGKGLSDEARDEADRLRRALPYKVARRLGELFREQLGASFDSGRWREAVSLTGNRIGLVFCGDLDAALTLLREEDPSLDEPLDDLVERSALVHDLLNFSASNAYYICRGKLGLGE